MFSAHLIHTLRHASCRYLPGSRALRRWLRAGWTLLGASLAGICSSVHAAGNASNEMSEYQLKAAYLFNFIAFTEWPDTVGDTLTLCIYGPDPFGNDIGSFEGKNVNDREVRVVRISTADLLDDCSVVFISSDVIGNLRRVLDAADSRPLLIVADSPGAAAGGVGVNMNMEQSKVTFEVNLAALRDNQLEISFQLLRLATKVYQ